MNEKSSLPNGIVTHSPRVFAFEDLMPVEQRLMLAKRAVIWADSTVDIERLAK